MTEQQNRCPFFNEERATAYLEQDISQEDNARIREHLRRCETCRQYIVDAAARGIFRAQMAFRSGIADTVYAAVRSAADAGKEWAKQQLSRLDEALLRAYPLLRPRPSATCVPVPVMGESGSSWPERLSVEVVDSAGRPTGTAVQFRVHSPALISEGGVFDLVLETDQECPERSTLLCTVAAIEDVRVTFEAAIHRQDSNYVVRVRAEGLPSPGADLTIPFDHVQLHLREA